VLTAVWAAAFIGGVFGTKLGPGAPVAIGLAVAAAALAGLPYTGAALNPARALASSVAAIDFSTLWMYATGPLAGAAVAGLLGRLLLLSASQDSATRRA
jgi:glycerol uptake facilitator-like aquaporin